MNKVYLICGKICSGKTTYAKRLCEEKNAILLSVDEIMLSLFDQCCGPTLHQEYERRLKSYLFDKALEILANGSDVVFDWGFWTKEERSATKEFFKDRNIECELHYVAVSDEKWEQQLNKRNNQILNNEVKAYALSLERASFFASLFNEPDGNEIDVCI